MSAIPFVPNWALAFLVGGIVLLYPYVPVSSSGWTAVRSRIAEGVSPYRAWGERVLGGVIIGYGIYELIAPLLSNGSSVGL